MRHIAVVSIALCSLSLVACRGDDGKKPTTPVTQQYIAPDKIMIANTGSKKIEDVVIETNGGDVLWEGDLIGSQEMAFQFSPEGNGHFVIKYNQGADQPQELHKGYFTTKGGLLHSFTFDNSGSVNQRTSRNLSVNRVN